MKGLFFPPLLRISHICWDSADCSCIAVFLDFDSILLIYMSVNISVLHHLDYCSFIESFRNRECESSNFLFSFSWLFCLFRFTYNSIWILGSAFLFLKKRLLSSWYWTCRSLWVALSCWQYCFPNHNHKLSYYLFSYLISLSIEKIYSVQFLYSLGWICS